MEESQKLENLVSEVVDITRFDQPLEVTASIVNNAASDDVSLHALLLETLKTASELSERDGIKLRLLAAVASKNAHAKDGLIDLKRLFDLGLLRNISQQSMIKLRLKASELTGDDATVVQVEPSSGDDVELTEPGTDWDHLRSVILQEHGDDESRNDSEVTPEGLQQGLSTNIQLWQSQDADRLRQMVRLAGQPEDLTALMTCDYTDARSVSAKGTILLPTLAEYDIPAERADDILHKAQLITEGGDHAERTLLQSDSNVAIFTSANASNLSPGAQAAKAAFSAGVSFSSMFQATYPQGCEHCASVTGPSAFFVHLLHTLAGVSVGGSKSSLRDQLFQRRPDLAHLQLTCTNTNVLIPYVDIVNETLEAIAWVDANPGTDVPPPYNMGGQDTTELNTGRPQHTLIKVYQDVIQPLVTPMATFPFNHATQRLRAYLKALNTSLEEVLRVFRAPLRMSDKVSDKVRETIIGRFSESEALSLQHEDYNIICGQDIWDTSEPKNRFDVSCHRSWGFESEKEMLSPDKGLTCIQSSLLSRSGMTLEELVDLLRTELFHSRLIITSKDGNLADDNLDMLRLEHRKGINTSLPTLRVDDCWLLQGFIRLRKSLDWPVEQLSAVLYSLEIIGPKLFKPATLSKLAAVKELARLTGLSPVELQPFWAPMDHFGPMSLYAQRFLARPRKPDDVFGYDDKDRVLQKENIFIEDHLLTVLSGVGLRQEGWEAVKSHLDSQALSLRNLSRLYSIATLCRILGISPADYNAFLLLYPEYREWFRSPNTTLSLVREFLESPCTGARLKVGDMVALCLQDSFIRARPLPLKSITDMVASIRRAISAAQDVYHGDGSDSASKQQVVLGALLTFFPDMDKEAMEFILTAILKLDIRDVDYSLKSDDMTPSQTILCILANVATATPDGVTVTVHTENYFIPPKTAVYEIQVEKTGGTLELDGTSLPISADHTAVTPRLIQGQVYFLSSTHEVTNIYLQTGPEANLANREQAYLIEKKCVVKAQPILERVVRLVKVIQRWKIDTREIETFHESGVIEIGVLDRKGLRWLETYHHLRGAFLKTGASKPLHQLFKTLHSLGEKSITRTQLVALLVSVTGRSSLLCSEYLEEKFRIPAPEKGKESEEKPLDKGVIDSVTSLSALVEMDQTMQTATRLGSHGLSLRFLFDLAQPREPDERVKFQFDHAQILCNAVGAQSTALKAANDEIRTGQRRALVQYLLSHRYSERLSVTDADGLFEHLLIDVQMGAAFQTTRMKQAISTVQLFIKRCLIGAEIRYGVNNSDLKKNSSIDWEQLCQYRLWEANQKAILHPESWADPTLRDNKTEQFQRLESRMSQDKLSREVIQDMVHQYLSEANSVAQLRVEAYHWDEDPDATESGGGKARLHVFARTQTQPLAFYHRVVRVRFLGDVKAYHRWTPWARFSADVPMYDTNVNVRNPSPMEADNLVEAGKRVDPFEAQDESTRSVNNIDQSKNKPPKKSDAKSDAGKGDKKYEQDKMLTAALGACQGSYIVPTILDGRLVVFLPEISLQQRPNDNFAPGGKVSMKDLNSREVSIATSKWWEIKMARTDFRNGSWSEKVVYPTTMKLADAFFLDAAFWVIQGFRFWFSHDANGIPGIDVEHPRSVDYDGSRKKKENDENRYPPLGRFELRGNQMSLCTDKEAILKSRKRRRIARPFRTAFGHIEDRNDNSYLLWPFYTRLGVPMPRTVDGEKIETPSERMWTFALNSKHTYGLSTLAFNDLTGGRHQQFLGVPQTPRLFDRWMYLRDWDMKKSGKDYARVFRVSNTIMPSALEHVDQGGTVPSWYKFLGTPEKLSPEHWDAFGRPDASSKRFHEESTSFAVYFWELGVHLPSLLMERLMATQQYELALEVARNVFDPTRGDKAEDCWLFPPFQKIVQDSRSSSDWLKEITPEEVQDANASVHAAARLNPRAYMKRIVLKYIEALVALGDNYFRQATMEAIPMAIERYVEASHLFGPGPPKVPKMADALPMTYKELPGQEKDGRNPYVDSKPKPPFFNGSSKPMRIHYFCVPGNPQLVKLRQQIDQRLYNIRNGLDLYGNPLSLAVWEPLLDPGRVLASGKTGNGGHAGLLADLSSPMPRYRFRNLIQRAYDIVAQVRVTGEQLQSIREKKDAESLLALRAAHQNSMLALTMRVREHQKTEILKSIESLRETRSQQEMRLRFYISLTGDKTEIPAENEAWKDIEQSIMPPTKDDLRMSPQELQEMDETKKASNLNLAAGIIESSAAAAFAIPTASVKTQPMGCGMDITYGGHTIGQILLASASAIKTASLQAQDKAGLAARTSGLMRQLQERRLEANIIGRELVKIDKELAQLQARLVTHEAEVFAHQKEIECAAAEEKWLRNKYSNTQLYASLENMMDVLFNQTYVLAWEMIATARRALDFEYVIRGDCAPRLTPQLGFQGSDLAGHALYLEIKRMESSYMNNKSHDFEIAKAVSLRQLSPVSLLALREKGSASFKIPEVIFDMDYPGHYCRRLSAVAVSIPCILASYATLSCTLKLTKNEYRISKDATDSESYLKHEGAEFQSDTVPISVIAVSSGFQDSGVFNLDFESTDKYGPFEGAGAISTWDIKFPTDFPSFDYRTISDVILHLRYTSFDGGGNLAKAATEATKQLLGTQQSSSIAIDLKHDYPNEWRRFLETGTMPLPSLSRRLPFWARLRGRSAKTDSIALILYPDRPPTAKIQVGAPGDGEEIELQSEDKKHERQLPSLLHDSLKEHALQSIADLECSVSDTWAIQTKKTDKELELGWLIVWYSTK
ncbi:PA14 domain protein [Fusarium tjaetaba]|uniref:PA14 domain protein n=1 Tax=Fusarium tjaetaba TaxID=1567544 RepID=A0A8H5SEE3_9HYPO|nr:PA14 domain protein [Fusarium tjaetaba]KAF5649454.1 PA14 domain protein [Fusarium tjaetaba]